MGLSAKSTVSVYLLDLPQMLEDALRQALADEAFDVCDRPPGTRRSTGPSVAVMADGGDRQRWMAQLERRPDLSILLIEPRDCDAELIELRPQHRSLGCLDTTGIVAAIRSAARWEGRQARTPTARTRP